MEDFPEEQQENEIAIFPAEFKALHNVASPKNTASPRSTSRRKKSSDDVLDGINDIDDVEEDEGIYFIYKRKYTKQVP